MFTDTTRYLPSRKTRDCGAVGRSSSWVLLQHTQLLQAYVFEYIYEYYICIGIYACVLLQRACVAVTYSTSPGLCICVYIYECTFVLVYVCVCIDATCMRCCNILHFEKPIYLYIYICIYICIGICVCVLLQDAYVAATYSTSPGLCICVYI